MKITDIEIRACRHKDPVMKDSEMRGLRTQNSIEFLNFNPRPKVLIE